MKFKKIDFGKGFNKSKINTLENGNKNNDTTKIDYYKDISITSSVQDEFKHIHYVDVLMDILLKSQTPINIGLYGRWGVGKSSILSMLEEKIRNSNLSEQFKFLIVDAWGLSEKTLKQEILVELNTQLETFTLSEIEDRLYNVKQELYFGKDLLKGLWPLSIIPAGLLFGYFVRGQNFLSEIYSVFGISTGITILIALLQFLISPSKRIIPQAASSHQFERLYEEMIRKEEKKLVVIIDNLDRCNDDVAVELLGVIQTFMTKPNCINILACDDKAIINHLRRVKGESYTEREGNEFLSKFFQVTIRIPPFIPGNLDSYVTRLMEQRHIPFHHDVKPVLISGAIKNPRKVNQFLNNLVALYRLADFKEKDNRIPPNSITKRTDFLAKIIILQHEWPKFYDELDKVQNPSLLHPKNAEFKNWLELTKSTMAPHDYDEQQFEGLEDFLIETQYCFVNDMKPFLRLSQPSYEGEIRDIEKFDNNVRRNRIEPILEVLTHADDKGKESHIREMCSINEQNEKELSYVALLNSTQALISACEVVENPSTREIALKDLGRRISSSLMKEHLPKYDMNKLFPLIKEMPDYFAEILYRNYMELMDIENKLNEDLITKFLDVNMGISNIILNEFDNILTKLSTTYEDKILEIIAKNCISNNWSDNKFTKPIQFVTSFINKINVDNTPIDNKRLETYLAIQRSIDVSERESLVRRLQEIIDTAANTGTLLPEKILEIIDNFDGTLIQGYDKTVNMLFDSLVKVSTSTPDLNQKKKIFEILFKLIELTKGDVK